MTALETNMLESNMVPGRMRLYIGAAAGVGTTYAMLDEGLRRSSRGTQVCVGWVNAHKRSNTISMLESLLNGLKAPSFLDVDKIIDERPQVVLIDELATSTDGISHWSAIEKILAHGIDVIATLNVQNISSLSDRVQEIMGYHPADTIPDRILFAAEQIEMVDITPEAIRRRIAHGNVFEPNDLQPSDADLFNSDAFARLRALLMNWMSQYVEARLPSSQYSAEKILVLMNDLKFSENPADDRLSTGDLLYGAARSAHRDGSQLIGLYVSSGLQATTDLERSERKARIENLGGKYYEIFHEDVLSALISFAAFEGVSRLVIEPSFLTHHSRPRRRIPKRGISRSRIGAGLLLAVFLLTILTFVLVQYRNDLSVSTSLALYLLAVVGVSAVGGGLPGAISAIFGPLLANWYLIAPYHTFRINDGENLLELVIFVSASIIVSTFVSLSARRTAEADEAWSEASTLSALADSGEIDTIKGIVELMSQTFSLEGVSIFQKNDETISKFFTTGPHPPEFFDAGDFSTPLGEEWALATTGPPMTASNYRLLQAFLAHLGRALEQQKLREIAVEADMLLRADELRTAILRAVSHDLRSPLASIKATVSSLRQQDLEWPVETQQEFLAAIESETDRLTGIVTNLLDLSRLEAGVLQPIQRALSLEEVVPSVVHDLGKRARSIEVDIPQTLSEVDADPALLERIIFNLVDNALKWSPSSDFVTIRAHERAGRIQLHVIDHGPGIPPEQKSIVIQPFHRLGDINASGGLGLGLAIADRMVAAMNGNLELRDTPHGGLTAVLTLPAHGKHDS